MSELGEPLRVSTVQTTRIEVLDQTGCPRLILGDLGFADDVDGPYGVSVLDAEGHPRLWVMLAETGPALVVDQGGNVAVQLGVDDPTPDATDVGAYLHLARANGTTVASWRVEEDGTLTIRPSARGG